MLSALSVFACLYLAFSSESADDSIATILGVRADSVFQANKKVITKKAQAYLAPKFKSVEIDSIALADFTWSDSPGTPRITEYEYTAWIIISEEVPGMIRIVQRGGKFVDSPLDREDINSDDKILRMRQEIKSQSVSRAAKRYRATKAKTDSALVRCINAHANDPSSIQFISADVLATDWVTTTYSVSMRGRNAFGALMLVRNHVTLSREYACESVRAPE